MKTITRDEITEMAEYLDEQENKLCCPMCGSANIKTFDYERMYDRQTGYFEVGTRYECQDCGSRGELE